jgi:hypothetical protein
VTKTQWWRSSSSATHSTLTTAMNAGDLYASGLISDVHDLDMLLLLLRYPASATVAL